MPIEHKSGAIATYRNLPQATRNAIGSLSMLLRTTQGDVITDAVAVYVEKLKANGQLPEMWDRVVERQARAGIDERTVEVTRQLRRPAKMKPPTGAPDADHTH